MKKTLYSSLMSLSLSTTLFAAASGGAGVADAGGGGLKVVLKRQE